MTRQWKIKRSWAMGAFLALAGSAWTCAVAGSPGVIHELAERALKPKHASWKEEVLLHDGRRVIAERTQNYGGFPTFASQERAVLNEEWVFPMPESGEKIVWKSDFRRPPEGDSLMLLKFDILNGVPYIATTPAGCLSYNYWKRPNPPYVLFEYDGVEWRQIALAAFPAAFKVSNVVVGGRSNPERQLGTTISAEEIDEYNRVLEPYLKLIDRELLPSSELCPPERRGFKAPYPISKEGSADKD